MDQRTQDFVAQFATDKLPVGATATRQQAASQLAHMSLPITRWEAWKYTSVKPLLEHSFQAPKATEVTEISDFLIPDLNAHILVFVNGTFRAGLSDAASIEGLQIQNLADVSAEQEAELTSQYGKLANAKEDVFAAVNTAYVADGVWIQVAKKAVIERPIHIIHLSDAEQATAIQTRNLFTVGAFAQAKIVESFHSLSTEATFRNMVTELYVGDNAHVEFVKLQLESHEAMSVDRTEVSQGKDSQANLFTITLGGTWVRNNLHFHLQGENTTSILNGLYMLDKNQHVDNHTLVDHFQAHCYSDELYKGILTDDANAAFRGKIHVHPDAQKTNAYQSNRNILLSETASINTKPQLEIYADDVKCSHGATTGQIDEDALFYLQARGIPLKQAQKLMVFAFAGETIEKLTMEPVATFVEQLIENRF